MNKFQTWGVGIVLLVACVLPLSAQSVGEQLIQKLNGIKSLTADFVQSVRAHHKQISIEHGCMTLERPGRFRWEVKTPVKQLLLADGQQIWIYDPELEQLTIKSQSKAIRGTPALFLSDANGALLKDFNVHKDIKQGMEIFQLDATSARPTFVRMILSFEGPTLRAMVMEDQLGQRTEVTLNHVIQNQVVSQSTFKFKPPRGIDVIRE